MLKRGGHDIPEDVVRRRYRRGLENLFGIFMPICDYWIIINNSLAYADLIAEGKINIDKKIYDNDIWQEITKYDNE